MVSRIAIEERFGAGTKSKAAQIAERIALAKQIITRLETERVIHYDVQVLTDGADQLLSGNGMSRKQWKAWDRYKHL